MSALAPGASPAFVVASRSTSPSLGLVTASAKAEALEPAGIHQELFAKGELTEELHHWRLRSWCLRRWELDLVLGRNPQESLADVARAIAALGS